MAHEYQNEQYLLVLALLKCLLKTNLGDYYSGKAHTSRYRTVIIKSLSLYISGFGVWQNGVFKRIYFNGLELARFSNRERALSRRLLSTESFIIDIVL